MFDLAKGVYRVRELTREPLPMAQLRFANPREEAADRLRSGRMTSSARPTSDGGLELSGTVEDGRHRHEVSLTIDADQRMTRGQCDCNFFQQNKLFKGPCEHLLALRFHHRPAGPARPGPTGRRRALSSFTLSVRPNHPPGVFHARSDQAAHLATRTVDRRPCNLAWHASLARS
jgi:hypothetical protein